MRRIAILFLSLLIALPTFAQTTTKIKDEIAKNTPIPEPPGIGSLLFSLAGMMLVIFVIFGFVIWLARMNRFKAKMDSGTNLQLIEELKLNHRCSVHLMQSGDQSILVGTDQAGIQATLVLPDEFDEILDNVDTTA
jgi:flagellar biogenesis protein FliO